MQSVARWLRAGIFLIVPACWIVLIVDRGPADSTAPAGGGTVQLKDVKYNGLVEAVRAQRGKVVVVDVWASFCAPCMKNYPHMLEMQRKYAAEGLVSMSLTVDQGEKAKGAALKFLEKVGSTIPNYWMDEKPQVWAERWGTNGPPVIFVFDRAGRRAGKFMSDPDRPWTVEDIEKLVKELLAAKP